MNTHVTKSLKRFYRNVLKEPPTEIRLSNTRLSVAEHVGCSPEGLHTDMPRHDSLRSLLSAASLSSISCSDVTAHPADPYPFRGCITQDSELSCFCQMKWPFRRSVILQEQWWNVRLNNRHNMSNLSIQWSIGALKKHFFPVKVNGIFSNASLEHRRWLGY